MTKSKPRIGVVGAGTMGSGIALAALYAGHTVVLQDAYPAALDKGGAYVEEFLAKKEKSALRAELILTEDLADLAICEVVIEAALEDLELKRELFSQLEGICKPDAILASNTSTLSVTAIAAATQHPGRVAGLHFFNPAPVLPLVEVVRAAQTEPRTIERLVSLAESLGKTPVVVSDTPGFIVNRVARPFYGEALRIMGEGAATHAQIDRIVERAGGFQMGPFRLMDLIGIDINAGAMRSMYEQTFGEARYRPHPIQMQKLAEGALGRKTGRGFYDYGDDANPDRRQKKTKAKQAKGEIWLSRGSWTPGLEEKLQGAGYKLVPMAKRSKPVAAFLRAGWQEDALDEVRLLTEFLPAGVPLFVQTADIALSEFVQQGYGKQAVGFDGLFVSGNFVTLQDHTGLSGKVREKAEEVLGAAGLDWEWVAESPALVLPRILAQLVNEAAFALQDGVADAETIDLAMRLGVNYPQGPLQWGAALGYEKVLAILDDLYAEFHEERYRASSLLRRWVRAGNS